MVARPSGEIDGSQPIQHEHVLSNYKNKVTNFIIHLICRRRSTNDLLFYEGPSCSYGTR